MYWVVKRLIDYKTTSNDNRIMSTAHDLIFVLECYIPPPGMFQVKNKIREHLAIVEERCCDFVRQRPGLVKSRGAM